ncbi:MAG: hypothetical protein ABL929_09490 [Ferruginibacter sp.]|nr:hypothetical protein [Ferruginibacter sp.]
MPKNVQMPSLAMIVADILFVPFLGQKDSSEKHGTNVEKWYDADASLILKKAFILFM